MVARTEVLIRHFRDGDEQRINDLFNRVFETNRPLEQWRWKFQANPAKLSAPIHIVLGESESKIVSQLAAIARDLWMRGEPHQTVQIVDNLIDPAYRSGRHLLRDMLAFYGEHVRAQGNDFTFGCPNDAHYRVGKRLLAYEDFFAAPRLFRRLNLRLSLRQHLPNSVKPVADALGRLSAWGARLALLNIKHSEFRVVETVDERFDRFWDLAKGHFTILGVRDRAYLQWRYFQRPDARFILLSAEDNEGMKAWVVLNVTQLPDGSRIGYLVDFLYVDEPVMGQLLLRGLFELSRLGADYAIAVAAPGSAGDRLVRAAGFREREGFDPVRMSIRWYTMQDKQSQSIVLNPVNWHLCHGDLDLVL
jgi:hypothetical protein